MGGLGHLPDAVVPVVCDGMHVHVAADVDFLNQPGKGVVGGRLDLAQVFAQLGRNPLHVQRSIDLFFGGRGDDGIIVQPGQRPFAERVAHLESPLAQGHVVRLGPGKVLQRRAVGLRGQQANVHLHAVGQVEADLVFTLGDQVGYARKRGHVFDRRGGLFGRAGTGRSPADPDRRQSRGPRRSEPAGVTLSNPAKRQQVKLDPPGRLSRLVDAEPPGAAPVIVNALADLFELL